MFSKNLKKSIMALVAIDEEVTNEERDGLLDFLSGVKDSDSEVLISFNEAAERLGVHKNTIRNLVKSGSLVAIKGSGLRMVGVTKRSLDNFLLGQK